MALENFIKFSDEKLPYKVVSTNERFSVCTRWADKKVDKELLKEAGIDRSTPLEGNVVIYTLVDEQSGVRSTNNKVFNPYDYREKEDCDKCLQDLISGDVELSRRNQVPLLIEAKYDYGAA